MIKRRLAAIHFSLPIEGILLSTLNPRSSDYTQAGSFRCLAIFIFSSIPASFVLYRFYTSCYFIIIKKADTM